MNVRAGRANPAILNKVEVLYYGVPTPLNQLAQISIPEARQLAIKPFDKSCLGAIEKGIYEANIGLTPNNNGETIILNIPALTEETRREYVKQVREICLLYTSGVNTGDQLRIAGKGEAGSNGGPNGDIYLEFKVADHKLFIRDDNDIYLKVPITITEAMLGCKKEIPTLYGNVILTIPAGSNTNDKHRLKGKGVKEANSSRTGDMYVLLNVVVPKKLSRDQKKLVEALAKTKLEDDSEFKSFHKFVKENEK